MQGSDGGDGWRVELAVSVQRRTQPLLALVGGGVTLGPGEAEVHHLSYERVGRELPEDLVALCPGCHRRAHP